ncbi:hypothetical protein RUM44_005716 [Polyplax serrata]|uniref:Uncharacterized protein n=1 Tax=Polyplax serrata TaxID=468196 RepID=A0ABR1AWZ3_POLSC
MFNPYFMYPPVVSGKPIFYPPFVNPSDLLLNRFAKSGVAASTSTKAPPLDASDPTLISAYFKAKKDEFLTKLFERLANTTVTTSELSARSVPVQNDTDPAAVPAIDPSYFLKKKYSFLEALFKSLNATMSPPIGNETDKTVTVDSPATTTTKPTIVPPDFWFPFPKLAKTPKPPKPTKPPKAKKVLKDALDTILLQSLLMDLGVDPKDASLSKRAAVGADMTKKPKSKKVKPEEYPLDFSMPDKGMKSKGKKFKPEEDLTEFFIPEKVNPVLFSSKALSCVDKLFKILNKTAEDDDMENYVQPKATMVPANAWTKPVETEYTSKLDAFLDLLIKSLNATEDSSEKQGKFEKFKGKPGKKFKRSTFLDELLHRVPTTPEPTTTTTTTTPAPSKDTDCEFIKEFLEECCCESCTKSQRSLIFRPFGSGYWIPQYLYAAKMGMYLDKLMDSINTAAANEVENENPDMLKRSLGSASEDDESDLSSKQTALSLIIAELSELKNNLVEAFTEGIKAQKDASPTTKPYGPPGKSFKKPFWGPKGGAAPTTDPIAPIQKRIDILNDVFDKLTKVEKTLIFTSEPDYDPKLIANLTEILDLTSPKFNSKSVTHKIKVFPTRPTENPESPAYFLAKTKEYLQNLYANKIDTDDK